MEKSKTIPEIESRTPKYFPRIGLGTMLPIHALHGGS